MSNEKFKVKYGLTVGENKASIDAAGKITADEIVLVTYPTTNEITEKNNLYYTDTRARAAVSAAFAGGDGSFSYDSETGVFTMTGPSASEVRAHLDVAVVKNIRSDETEQLVGNLEYDRETGTFTYTCPTTEDLRSLITVDRNSTLIISNTGVFSTNSSALANQVRIGANAGNGSPINSDPAVSIGLNAGQNKQIKNTIVINALPEPLNTPDTNTEGNGLYIKPIRSVNNIPGDERVPTKLQYNPGTGEVFYADDADFLDQGLRTTDEVKFGSIKLGDYTKIANPELDTHEAKIAYDFSEKKPVYHDGAKWCYFDGTAV